ncbi:hypothetical protein NDU88_000333 [Pleurodeles waltl]|uniref:Uncharacterized protein n=1 Tax=Pleurodeles waltl TaxID=8319 RepID=A0AAV7VUD6_PLEWA|nr:hypothetical protein NDU88_000333 [Pleurodeles waltl]
MRVASRAASNGPMRCRDAAREQSRPDSDGEQLKTEHRTGTDTAAPDPEAVVASSNPLSLPGNGGQGQEMRAFRVRLKEDPMRTGVVRVSRRKREMRASAGSVPSIEDCMETGRPSEALPEESKAREAPCEHSGHV